MTSQSHHRTRHTQLSYLVELSRKSVEKEHIFAYSMTGKSSQNAFTPTWRVTQAQCLTIFFFLFLSFFFSWTQRRSFDWKPDITITSENVNPETCCRAHSTRTASDRSSQGMCWRMAGQCFCLSECCLFPHAQDSAIYLYICIIHSILP